VDRASDGRLRCLASTGRPPVELDRARRRLEGLLGVHATEGNVVDVLRDGVEIFPAMLEEIE
jgi:hypothetical protein